MSTLVKRRSHFVSRRRTSASERGYLKQAFSHPLNVSVMVVLSVFALAYGAFPWLVMGVALELMALSALLHTEIFRSRADRYLAASELASLRNQLDGAQLRDLQRLEALALVVEKAAARPDSACSPELADGDSLRQLLDGYLRLSLSHKAGRELVGSTDRRAIEDEMATLQLELRRASPPLRRVLARRLELARRRVERLELASQRLQLVAQQLAAITEMIHFLHEQALAPADSQPWADDLDRLIGDLGQHEEALHELDAVADPA